MKRSVILILLLMTTGLTVAETACDLNVTLLQQDPYPAVPGEYAKLVFQVAGIESPDCKNLDFNLLEQYPIKFDPKETGVRSFNRVNYIKDYESIILIPYEVRIDEDALDGSNKIDVQYKSGIDARVTKEFDIEIDDPRVDFEVHVKNYNYKTKELTLEILNIEESNAEAVVVKIPKQNNIIIKGANEVIVGDIDSNEYTTADFEATPSDGQINLIIAYSDSINTRRTREETIVFDSSYFTNRAADEKTTGMGTYIFWGALILIVGWWSVKKFTKKKNK